MKAASSNLLFPFLVFCGLLMVVSSCKKKDSDYTQSSIALSITNVVNGAKLSWDKVNSSDFVRYEIFRSNLPIPEPTAKEPINSQLLIASVSNSDNIVFTDSLGVGTSYYRVQVVLKLRNLVSNSVQNTNGFSLLGSFMQAVYCKELHRIYFQSSTSSNKIAYFDCEKDTFVMTGVNYSFTNPIFTKNDQNQPVFYVVDQFSNFVTEYNATTLGFIKSHNIAMGSNNSSIANGFFYLNKYPDSLVTISLADDSYYHSLACNGAYISTMSSNGNAMVVAGPGSANNVYYFKIGADKKPVWYAQFQDMDNFLYSFCRISPNGKYIVSRPSNFDIRVLDDKFSYLGNLDNPNFSNYLDLIFTENEKYILGVTSFSTIEIFNLETRTLVTTVGLTTSAFSQPGIFLDGNTLITIENTFNQFTGQSTILVKKRTLDL